MIKGYKTVDEWQEDFKRFQKAPDDKDLLDHIRRRIDASNRDLQDEIVFELRNIGLKFGKDWDVLNEIKKESPHLTVIANSKDNIWFKC